MTVRELKEQLERIENQDSEITFVGNLGNVEDDDDDFYFDKLEVWEDGEETITLFLSLN